jgi:hypothetical protein
MNPDRINIIRWDPKLIEIGHNPITNENEYYLQVPEDLISRVKNGDAHLISTTPYSVLEAIAKETLYKFKPGKLYHMKADSPAGLESGWGYPPLTSTMHLFYHASILRKANEAIALERLTPMRVLHPQATSANSDPIIAMSVAKWMSELKENVKDWRRDPNHIMFSPVAVGVSQVGGEGRALMVDAEINRAEDNIIAALGFPKEFIYGGLSFTGSSVTLRMLENQLESSMFQLTNLLRWVANEVGAYMKMEEVKVSLGDFKMVDDVQQKQLVLNLFQMGAVSKTTLAESHGMDLAEERQKIKAEQLADANMQQEIQTAIDEMQNSLVQQARSQAAQGQAQGMNYDQQAVIGEADNIAQQLAQMEHGTRKSQLHSLQTEDFVLYSVVIQRLEQLQLDQRNQANAQVQEQGMPPVS